MRIPKDPFSVETLMRELDSELFNHRDLIADALIAYLDNSSIEKEKHEIIYQLLDNLFDVTHARRMGLDISR